jgi:hypothetical protein
VSAREATAHVAAATEAATVAASAEAATATMTASTATMTAPATTTTAARPGVGRQRRRSQGRGSDRDRCNQRDRPMQCDSRHSDSPFDSKVDPACAIQCARAMVHRNLGALWAAVVPLLPRLARDCDKT